MGTLINALAIVVGTILGVIFKKGLSESLQKALMFALGIGLSVLALGWFLKDFFIISEGVLLSEGDLLIIFSLVIGTLFGEWIDIDGRITRFAERVETRFNLPPLAKGFIAGTLIFCVGAMAILGAIQDGLTGEITILLVKSTLDFVTAIMLASVLGIGVMLAAVSVLLYQGVIFFASTFAGEFLSGDVIRSLSMVGSILLVVIGMNFMELKKIKVANMLPSLLIPIIYHIIISII